MEKNLMQIRERYGDMGMDVAVFNNHIQAPKCAYYKAPKSDMQEFILKRIGFIQEELSELAIAASKNNIPDIADAIVDILYFTIGTAVLMDMPLQKTWRTVHLANMQKVAGKTKRNVDGDAAKPDDFIPPNIRDVFNDDFKEKLKIFDATAMI